MVSVSSLIFCDSNSRKTGCIQRFESMERCGQDVRWTCWFTCKGCNTSRDGCTQPSLAHETERIVETERHIWLTRASTCRYLMIPSRLPRNKQAVSERSRPFQAYKYNLKEEPETQRLPKACDTFSRMIATSVLSRGHSYFSSLDRQITQRRL